MERIWTQKFVVAPIATRKVGKQVSSFFLMPFSSQFNDLMYCLQIDDDFSSAFWVERRRIASKWMERQKTKRSVRWHFNGLRLWVSNQIPFETHHEDGMKAGEEMRCTKAFQVWLHNHKPGKGYKGWAKQKVNYLEKDGSFKWRDNGFVTGTGFSSAGQPIIDCTILRSIFLYAD